MDRDREKLQRLENHVRQHQFQRKAFDMSDMILRHNPHNPADNSPHPLPYVETDKNNTHVGQMKLLLADEMSIMLGLLHICEQSKKTLQHLTPQQGRFKVAVVVAGAAPGDHFADLVRTFGFVNFHLYDPAPRGWYRPFTDRRKPPNVTLHTQEFTEQTAQEWRGKRGHQHVIFLSDLRTGNGMDQDGVEGDMNLQAEMTKAIGACYSVLKFRPRYCWDHTPTADKTLKYFDGTIYLQGYPPHHSTETRLHVTDPASEKTYDIELYQDQLFYHNQVTRNPRCVLFEPGGLKYDDTHARFVKHFLLQHLPDVSDRQVRDPVGGFRFDHARLRALLEDFKLIGAHP